MLRLNEINFVVIVLKWSVLVHQVILRIVVIKQSKQTSNRKIYNLLDSIAASNEITAFLNSCLYSVLVNFTVFECFCGGLYSERPPVVAQHATHQSPREQYL